MILCVVELIIIIIQRQTIIIIIQRQTIIIIIIDLFVYINLILYYIAASSGTRTKPFPLHYSN